MPTNEQYTIEYLKSAMSINTHLGCRLGCAYCTVQQLSAGWIGRMGTPEGVVQKLLSHRLFLPERTPLAINNRTDPLHRDVKRDTFRLLSLLEEHGITNPRLLISKLALEPDDLSFLEQLTPPVLFFCSYSGLSPRIEPLPHTSQLRTLETLKSRSRVHALHYWRPVIQGENDTEAMAVRVLTTVSHSCDASVISGLRLNHRLTTILGGLGVDLSGWEGDTKHKFLAHDSWKRIQSVRDHVHPGYALYRHTSCAIATALWERDYNLHFTRLTCPASCRNSLCRNPLRAPREEEVRAVLERLGLPRQFAYENNSLIIPGTIDEQERSYLMHALSYPVVPSTLHKAPSEEVLRE